MIRLARRHLFEDVPRLLASLGGIVFAVTLVMVQSGIFNGFVRSTSLLIEDSRADIWLAAREMSYLEVTLPLPYRWLAKARTIEGVASSEPLAIRSVIWKSPSGELDYGRAIGFDPDGSLLALRERLSGNASDLRRPYTFAADASQLDALGISGVGGRGTIRGRPARLVALTHGTQPIISPTFFYSSLGNAAAWSPLTLSELERIPLSAPSFDPDGPLSYVLIRAAPGADLTRLRSALEAAFPRTRALPRREMMEITRNYWIKRTNLGFILALGALLGLFVGAVVVAQILYTSVNEHQREYGTLKALGISDRMLYASIVWQAVAMAVLGYVPGLALSAIVAALAQARRGVSISITPLGALGVFGLTLAMCTGAALFAVQRVTRVDPAIVFKA
ncbi:MAG TPA: FtsX-like permease family protein [Candidatus Baltobacteraceae bacterium]|nr:FtsX-like permease family protein [Candidatus Baltobacteraceae bacterium]